MITKVLFCSIFLVLFGSLVGNPSLLGLGIVTTIVVLVWESAVPKVLLIAFWLWLNTVLLFLVWNPLGVEIYEEPFVFGLPLRTFVMLFGVWIVPILLWPVGFAVYFRRWISK